MKDERRSIAVNRRARHEFEVLDEMEVGVVLVGSEVKSLRAGRLSLQEAYVRIQKGELWLVGMHVPEYAQAHRLNHDPTRPRKLLARRREIEKWAKAVREKGTTIVPLEVLWRGALVKLRIGLCRGKKLHDKRRAKKERDDRRDMDRARARRR